MKTYLISYFLSTHCILFNQYILLSQKTIKKKRIIDSFSVCKCMISKINATKFSFSSKLLTSVNLIKLWIINREWKFFHFDTKKKMKNIVWIEIDVFPCMCVCVVCCAVYQSDPKSSCLLFGVCSFMDNKGL